MSACHARVGSYLTPCRGTCLSWHLYLRTNGFHLSFIAHFHRLLENGSVLTLFRLCTPRPCPPFLKILAEDTWQTFPRHLM